MDVALVTCLVQDIILHEVEVSQVDDLLFELLGLLPVDRHSRSKCNIDSMVHLEVILRDLAVDQRLAVDDRVLGLGVDDSLVGLASADVDRVAFEIRHVPLERVVVDQYGRRVDLSGARFVCLVLRPVIDIVYIDGAAEEPNIPIEGVADEGQVIML